jgi:aminoglycoside 6'-N-acetyltransferase I
MSYCAAMDQLRVERCREVCKEWIALRARLWPHCSEAEHRADALGILAPDSRSAIFLARDGDNGVVGFAEAALRVDYVNGCETSPVTFLEGIYVEPERRRNGVARALCDAVERWGAQGGCTEFASDALADNEASHRFHRAVGFEETERVVYFRKAIDA